MLGWIIGRSFEKHPSVSKYILLMFGIAAVFYSLGHALRPVADIVDELHDSNDSEEDIKHSRINKD